MRHGGILPKLLIALLILLALLFAAVEFDVWYTGRQARQAEQAERDRSDSEPAPSAETDP